MSTTEILVLALSVAAALVVVFFLMVGGRERRSERVGEDAMLPQTESPEDVSFYATISQISTLASNPRFFDQDKVALLRRAWERSDGEEMRQVRLTKAEYDSVLGMIRNGWQAVRGRLSRPHAGSDLPGAGVQRPEAGSEHLDGEAPQPGEAEALEEVSHDCRLLLDLIAMTTQKVLYDRSGERGGQAAR